MQRIDGKLFHPSDGFERQAFEERMSKYGFKNITRLELFLWDLEIFQQIQNILKDRVVLKGGAAVQFYLPIEAQRTSVDIDMIYNGTKDEIEQVLTAITDKLGGEDNLFLFKPHKPEKPKTQLPLYTYFVKVPSVLTEKELQKESNIQEIKVEFFTETNDIEISKMCGKDLFAISSELEYNVLPLDNLFADKLYHWCSR
ncbi:MAG: nucleotidyl transferase AbiEii/AbiGii toxin family protein [Clostridia bacterium]|jgi:predicted nucleotidyltransferase component of viral defense system|nr:nucleotidyl transferase AbiEii/AbiGii toxin family protein [Clostridia bacterium]